MARQKKEGKKSFQGLPLIEAIRARARDNGDQMQEVAGKFEVSYVYLTSLLSGAREISGLADDKKRKVAEYLGVPVAQIYILAEILKPEDFVIPQSLDERTYLSFKKLGADPVWSCTVPSTKDWNATPSGVRLLVALMYERLSETVLLDKAKALHFIKEPQSDKK